MKSLNYLWLANMVRDLELAYFHVTLLYALETLQTKNYLSLSQD